MGDHQPSSIIRPRNKEINKARSMSDVGADHVDTALLEGKPPVDDWNVAGEDLGRWQLKIFLSVFYLNAVCSGMFNVYVYLLPQKVGFWCSGDSNRTSSTLDTCWTEVNGTSQKCSDWEFDKSVFQWTLVERWDLVCDKEWLLHFSMLVALIGKFLGNLVAGFVSDRFGRRRTMLIGLVPSIAANTLCYLAPEMISFVVCLFVSSFFVFFIHVSIYVLLMETLGYKKRATLGPAATLGALLSSEVMTVLTYTLGDWRFTQLSVALPLCLAPFVVWTLPESPRWLILNDRLQEATAVFQDALRTNRRSAEGVEGKVALLHQDLAQEREHSRKSTIFLHALRIPAVRRTVLLTLAIWASLGVTEMSMHVNVTLFGKNSLVGIVLLNLAGVPGMLLSMLAVPRMGPKTCTLIGAALSAATTLACCFIGESTSWVQIALVGVVKSEVSFLSNSLHLLTAQVFPTVIRALGMGLCMTILKAFSFVAPYVSDMGTGEDKTMTPGT